MPIIRNTFEWNNQFNIGIYEIDEQHKNLVMLTNEALESIHQNQSNETTSIIINELAEYVWAHFQTEERWMQNCGYPGYLAHQQEHQWLARNVAQFQKKSPPDFTEICEFMQQWLIDHIMSSDQHFGDFLKMSSRAENPSPTL